MDSDVLIAGGGLVGNALAIALARENVRVCVVDPLPEATQKAAAFDGRTSAISHASVKILSAIGAWQHIVPHAQPIYDIRVCDQNKSGYVHYHYKDAGEDPFGYIIENQHIRAGLYATLKNTPNITAIYGKKVTGYTADDKAATATLDDRTSRTCALLVAADGRFSGLRGCAGLTSRVISYKQHALVTVIDHEKDHEGLALETFFPEGPFAALPLIGGHKSGIVWSVHENKSADYMALSDEDFIGCIHTRLQGEQGAWGKVTGIGKRFAYPLKLMHADQFYAKRFVLAGDSAHGIHPIAGQGVNLGYRDVAVLAELIGQQRRVGLDIGSEEMLARYQRWRKFDSVSMTASTDLLNRLFSNNSKVLGIARRAGLVAVEHMPGLKQFFMRHAMGMVGDLPRMLRETSTKTAA